jgi:septal ring factor EnvC (AmiA/AmiB activator)
MTYQRLLYFVLFLVSPCFVAGQGSVLYDWKGRLELPVRFDSLSHSGFDNLDPSWTTITFFSTAPESVHSIWNGEVTYVGHSKDMDVNYVIIKSAPYYFVYTGLDSIAVRKGQTLQIGQRIGFMAKEPGINRFSMDVQLRRKKNLENLFYWFRFKTKRLQATRLRTT